MGKKPAEKKSDVAAVPIVTILDSPVKATPEKVVPSKVITPKTPPK